MILISNTELSDLINKFGIEMLEKHLIHSFVTTNNYDISKSSILTEYFSDFEINTTLFLKTNTLNITSIKELENLLELLIPEKDRKLNGAFFTPNYIIDFILSEIQPTQNSLILDPSCGSGAFLINAVEYLKIKYNKNLQSIVRENIFGTDILEYNIKRAKLLISLQSLQYGETLENEDFNLVVQDSTRADWKNTFRNNKTGKFDCIIGNPPYVKFQDLSENNRTHLLTNWKTIKNGTFNLYFAFFELGYKLLNNTGKLGYITPNNYFSSLAGEQLRLFFQQEQCINRIVDFRHKKVFDAQTYTAITFLNRIKNENIIYDKISDNLSPEIFIKKVNGSPNSVKNLNFKKWRLLKTDEQKAIKTIETIGTPINQLFNIVVGIATLKDELFFIEGTSLQNGFYSKEFDNKTFKIEKELVRSVYKISDFKTQNEINKNTRKIIFPYKVVNQTAIPISEKEMEKQYPNCLMYFNEVKELLLARDKGKNNNSLPFYVYGRTQGLTKIGKKIVTPTFSQHPRFLIANDDEAFFTNGYGIYFKPLTNSLFDVEVNPLCKIENIEVVQKILNSYLMDYYITNTSISIEGGYPCYQKNFIEKFTIPQFSASEIETLQQLQDKHEIDKFLLAKYQINLSLPNLAE